MLDDLRKPKAMPEPGQVRHGLFTRPDHLTHELNVVCPIFNPLRFRSRWDLYEKFVHHMESAGARVWTVEVATGDRAFAVTDSSNPYHVQLRSHQELWLKENMINLAVQRFPHHWGRVAWIDPDTSFIRPDIVGETLHQLERYPIVQMFSDLQDVDDRYRVIATARSFAASLIAGDTPPNGPDGSRLLDYYYAGKGKVFQWHPGIAWAARREWWTQMGGLMDVCVLGSADTYMARSLLGDVLTVVPAGMTQGYRTAIARWQHRMHVGRWEERALNHIGVVEGTVVHHWHGPKTSRGYETRNNILVRNRFDPHVDLKPDWQGLLQLTNRSPQLRRDLQAYFAARNEDQLA